MRKLLAISGKRFSGKDTFAAMLVERAALRGITLETQAFAAESKRMFVAEEAHRGQSVDLELLLSNRNYKELWRSRLSEFTLRSLAKDPLVFCRVVADRIESAPSASVVTDLRLSLEIKHLRARFDLRVLRITRSDAQRALSGWSHVPEVDGHVTETELDDPALWDDLVANDGSLEALGERAEGVLFGPIS